MAYTLTLGATSQSPAAWDAQGLRLERQSLAPDTLTFVLAAAVDASLGIAVGDAAVLSQDGTTLFRGIVDAVNPVGQATSERVEVVCVGPWASLERLIAEHQTWQFGDGIDDTIIGQSLTRIIVGQTDGGAKRTIDAEVEAAITTAITEADIAQQIGAIDLGTTTLPYTELLDVTYAEMIRSILRWIPDAQSWYDYTVNPPALYIRRRATLDTVAQAIEETDLTALRVRARPDIQVRGVKIYFESTYQFNGQTFPQIALQTAGASAGVRIIKATISLEGSGLTTEEQAVKTRVISEGALQFWRDIVSAIKGVDLGDLTLVSGSGLVEDSADDGVTWGATSLPRILIEGSISDWMNVDIRPCRGKAKIKYTGLDDDLKEQLGANVEKWVTFSGYATDASTLTYSRVTSSWSGEEAPAGLAAQIYAALGVLHYEGEITLHGAECAFTWRPGQILNLTGGRAEWATMAAQVQSVTHDLDQGVTRIGFGPPAQLAPQDFAQMARANRSSKSSYRLDQRSDGTIAAASRVQGGEVQPFQDSQVIGGGGGGITYRFFSGAVSPAGAVPIASEMIDAVEAVYTAAAATPVEGDVVFIGTAFAYHISASSTLAITIFRFPFVVVVDEVEETWYAFGFQTGLF